MAVEFALCIPALLIVVFGGMYLARALNARARLLDAVGVATRTIAIDANKTGTVNDARLRQIINDRMATVPACAAPIAVEQRTITDPLPRLDVRATCNITAAGIPFMRTLNITAVTATASMPLDTQN